MEQKTCLAEQFNSYIRQRDDLLNKISHADSVLHSINHSVISTTGEYVNFILFNYSFIWSAKKIKKILDTSNRKKI